MKRPLLGGLTAFLLTLSLRFPTMAGTAVDYPRRPKLVVIIVIDQFRYDYLVRFRQQFGPDGFKGLMSTGACFADCRYHHANTATGPGHATLLTGAYPNLHGIIGNEWYDRSLHRTVNCVEDPATKLVGEPEGTSEAPAFSPHYLIGSTLGDELRAASDFGSKVVAISLKDRSAILPGGHSASAAYWYDTRTGRFVTSTYYIPALPAWAAEFNQNSPVKNYCGKKWLPLPESGNGAVFGEFKGSDEPCPGPKFLSWLDNTPFMSEIELAFVEKAIKGERLGQRGDTDLLTVSLSENDYIGHAYGPYSPQVADVTLRTDQILASLFGYLDKLVGLNNVWIALSADHGVSPNPEFIDSHHLGSGLAQPALIRKTIEEAMVAAFGPGSWVAAMAGPFIYLDSDALKSHRIQASQAEEVAATAAASSPGVTAAFTRTQILSGSLPSSPLAEAVANSYHSSRGGDVVVVLDPYAPATFSTRTTTHGTPWNYDSQVPLLLWGSVFKPGIYFTPCQPIDLAATLAAVLGLTQPSGSQGNPLTMAIK